MKSLSSVMVALLSSTFLSAPALAEWTPENKDGSAYSVIAGTADDYNFTTTDGETTSYWKINFNADNFSTSDSISWSTDNTSSTGSVEIKLPNSDTPTTLYYTYTMPEGYTETSTSIIDFTAEDVTSKVFKNINSRAVSITGLEYNDINITSDFVNNGGVPNGGAINVAGILNNTNIIGTFINNSAMSVGGAIYLETGSSLGDITGDFINNHVSYGGGAIYASEGSTIGNITGNFIGNYVQGSTNKGGAIYATNSTFGDIIGDFIGNYVSGNFPDFGGGAIYATNSTFGNITGDFIGNYVQSSEDGAYGGAIYANNSTFGGINGDFIGNYAQSSEDGAYGGAIYAVGSTFGNIIGDFIDNYASSASFSDIGGAIAASGSTFGDITGNFIGNYTSGSLGAQSGAINASNNSVFGNITGDFIRNYASSGSGNVLGGAIVASSGSTFGNITGDFIRNYAQGSSYVRGGAIYAENNSSFGDITGDFIGNHAQSLGNLSYSNAWGGAIYASYSTFGNITGDFIENYTSSSSSQAYGGAIYNNRGTIANIINSNFMDNYVEGNEESNGGAIWSNSDILITADNGASLFDGNKVNGESNAIYMQGTPEQGCSDCEEYTPEERVNLNLSAVNNGTITFNDAIDGNIYNINVYGDGTGVVKLNNEVKGVTNFTLGANSITHLGLNSKVYAQNMNISSSAIPSGNAVSSPIITVDVEVDKANNTVNAGQIHVDNDIEGDYRVLVNSLNPDVLDNTEDAVVPFLFAPEDDSSTASTFSVARVIGSPYMWDGSVNAKGEDAGSTWYLNLTDEENPDYVPPEPEPEPEPQPKPSKIYAPEVIAGIGLHEAAIEQTRSVVSNVRNKTSNTREYCDNCTGMYSYEWDGKKLRNIWALAQGESANIDKPVDMEAKIWGLEAGFDVQSDLHNTLGVFASYRKGQYDLSGKGSKLRSNIGSEIDINSYLAGLYYRYDHNFNWLLGTIYGGMQEAEVETEDHIAKFDTDGIEFGASIEFGRTIPLARDLTLDPSVGLYYTQVNFDDADDNVGKHYEWEDIKHLEAELGAKLEKQFDNAKVYVKPSVIQTITGDDKVTITGLSKADTYHDQTLGRIEIGGRYGFTDALSAYAW